MAPTLAERMEEVVFPKELKEFLGDVVEGKHGFELGEPWKFSDKALLVVVPIKRKNAPNRAYVTMYEVLKEMGMKDTGSIDQVELQNRTGKAVFVRAGTIFAGETQNRAAQHSGVYQPGKEEVDVRCVQQTHGIRTGAQMSFGDIAPMSITMNLMAGDQGAVWDSVLNYTSGGRPQQRQPAQRLYRLRSPQRRGGSRDRPQSVWQNRHALSGSSRTHEPSFMGFMMSSESTSNKRRTTCDSSEPEDSYLVDSPENLEPQDSSSFTGLNTFSGLVGGGSDDLLGHLKKVREGQKALDEMMQKVPLFEDQVGAIIFNPVGVIAVETFDSPKSWEAIKKEVIEKYGDQVSNEQAEHLFELKPDKIMPLLKKFLASLDKFEEKTIRKDDLSETRAVWGGDVVGEYTLVRGRTVHVLLIRDAAS